MASDCSSGATKLSTYRAVTEVVRLIALVSMSWPSAKATTPPPMTTKTRLTQQVSAGQRQAREVEPGSVPVRQAEPPVAPAQVARLRPEPGDSLSEHRSLLCLEPGL